MIILAVDNETYALSLLVNEINKAITNAKILSFSSSTMALQYAKENPVDIAFLDIDMPQIDGISLAKQLKNINYNINIIFVTAYSEYSLDAFELHASGYLLKPITTKAISKELNDLRCPILNNKTGIYAITFGNFELIVNNNIVHFKRSKSKEMLAFLIDKHGNGVTKKELALILFEDKPYTLKVQDYLNKIIKELENALMEVGASKLLIKKRNFYAVDTTQFSCDLYNYEKGIASAINSFKGEYMSEYSWAEYTLANLIN